MSLLQSHLHALPPGSTVTKPMMADQVTLNRLLSGEARREVALARSLVAKTGCTWAEAIRLAARHFDKVSRS